jgi:hypothetical protein
VEVEVPKKYEQNRGDVIFILFYVFVLDKNIPQMLFKENILTLFTTMICFF